MSKDFENCRSVLLHASVVRLIAPGKALLQSQSRTAVVGSASETVPRRDSGPELTGTYLQRVSEADPTTAVRSTTVENKLPSQRLAIRRNVS